MAKFSLSLCPTNFTLDKSIVGAGALSGLYVFMVTFKIKMRHGRVGAAVI